MSKSSNSPGAPALGLRKGEIWGGFLYLPFYLGLTAMLVQGLFGALDAPLTLYQLNVAVFLINAAAVGVIFHRFLFDSLRQAGRHFWLFIQAVILAVVFYFALMWVVDWLLSLLPVRLNNANNDQVTDMLTEHPVVMTVCTCLLASLVEECLCRGLIFGLLRQKNRILAYALSMLLFALLHVWVFAGTYTLANFLLVTATYLPAGLVLCWAFEKSGSIWGAILTHAVINLISCYQVLAPA